MNGISPDAPFLQHIVFMRAQGEMRDVSPPQVVPAAMLGHPLQEVAGTAYCGHYAVLM